MKNWQIPSKTFFLGEYLALFEQPAILIATKPSFEISFDLTSMLPSFLHPESPARLFLEDKKIDANSLIVKDPYKQRGGLGASSAEFIGSYLLYCYLQEREANYQDLLDNYYQYAWSGLGYRPSGYDLLCQFMGQSLYIDLARSQIEALTWNFSELNFILVHSGQKLATHSHLSTSTLSLPTSALKAAVLQAKEAFLKQDSLMLIDAVNTYHLLLSEAKLVAEQSAALIKVLATYPEVKAIKGCGAMGADILLILCLAADKDKVSQKLASLHLSVIADRQNLCSF